LAAHMVWTKWKPLAGLEKSPAGKLVWGGIAHVLTLGVVLLGFVFFRSPSLADAMSYLGRLVSWTHSGTRLDSPYILGAVLVVIVTHLVVGKDRNLALELPKMPPLGRIAGYATLLLLLVLLAAADSSPFIYFRF